MPQCFFRWMAVANLMIAWAAGPLVAQVARPPREYPSNAYYVCFRLLDDGDYIRAESALRTVARSGLRTSEGPWVDSICYFTMLGECYYQMGDLGRALEQYSSALRLYLADSSWMLRVEFPPTVDAVNAQLRTPITWGTSQRRTSIARMPNRYAIMQGTVNPQRVLIQGGVLAPPEFMLINAHEILRCAALSIRRRAEIMGRACRHDPLTADLLTALTLRPAPPNHWSQSWVDALLGLAYVSAGRTNEAVTELTKSVQIAGQFDHPLTPEVLVELGKLAFHQQQYGTAATLFLEATFSAAWFEQYDVMAEAFRWGTLTHLVTGPSGMYPPLEPAIAWARRERVAPLEGSLLIAQAQNAVELGQTSAAAALLDRARRVLNRSEMLKGAAGARLNYVTALVGFQSANLAAGEAAWNEVAAFQVKGQRIASQRLFEIGLVDGLATSGQVSPRIANELYADVLREPSAGDWTTNPVETMATVLAPNFAAHEHWFNVALDRNEVKLAAEIADRIRRLRFYSTLPMGGRLLALAWVLEAPKEALPDPAVLQRQDLLTRFPKYAETARRSAELRDQLAKLPLVAPTPDAAKQQQKLWAEWAAVSDTQEIMLREIAIRREAADFVFPPPLTVDKLKDRLAPNQAVLAFLFTSQNQLHGFLISPADCEHWRIDGANKLVKDVSELLRQFGQYERNTSVELELLKSGDWTATAAKLWATLTNEAEASTKRDFHELVLVPDRFLWYLPFESLPMDRGADKAPLLTQCQVRYVPTVSLAVADRRPASVMKDTVVVAGKLFNSDDAAYAAEAANDLRKVLDRVTELNVSLPAPAALLAALGKRTLVLQDLGEPPGAPYDWAPLQLDRDKAGNSLAQWLALPWGAPDQIMLPGFHSAAESALRRGATGDDLFLPLCGLMAAGSRTVVVSRWRTGGQTSFDLMREFVQELPFVSAANAWQRSVQLVRDKELRLDREPRVKTRDAEASIKATHPFFWAGYLVVDSGATPRADEPKKK